MDQREKLRVADRFALRFQTGAQSVGEGEIHIVAAEKDMLADADALEVEDAFFFRNRDQREIGGAAADVANEDDIAGTNLRAPIGAGLGGPGVKRRERLFQQNDLAKPRRLRGFRRQIFRDFIEGGGDGQNDFGVGGVKLPAFRAHRMAETFLDMFKAHARSVEGREFFLLDLGLPRQHPLPWVDMRVRQPGFCRSDQAVRNQRAVLAREKSDDRLATPGGPPGQRESRFGKLVGMGDIKGGRQGGLLADPIGAEHLGEFDDVRAFAVDIRKGDRAVARAEVDAETETSGHRISTSAGAIAGKRPFLVTRRGSLTHSALHP